MDKSNINHQETTTNYKEQNPETLNRVSQPDQINSKHHPAQTSTSNNPSIKTPNIRRKAQQYAKKCEEGGKWPITQKVIDPYLPIKKQSQGQSKLKGQRPLQRPINNNRKPLNQMIKESQLLKKEAQIRLNNLSSQNSKKVQVSLKKQSEKVVPQFVRARERDRSKQLYPCSFCAKELTLDQIEKHHEKCGMAFRCEHCLDFFSLYLVKEHPKFCSVQSKSKTKQNFQERTPVQNKRKYQKQPSEEQIEAYMNMLMDQFPDMEDEQIRAIIYADLIEKNGQLEKDLPKSLDELLDQDEDEDEDYGEPYYPQEKRQDRGLSEKQANRLVTDTYQRGEDQRQPECAICSNLKQEGDMIIRLPCFHTYHVDCIVPWLQMKSTCPTCKHSLKSK